MAYRGYPGGRSSNVDETLFGPKAKRSAKSDTVFAIIGKDTVQVRKRVDHETSGRKQDAAVMISASELNRLRDSAKMLTRDEEVEMKKRADEAYEERMKKSAERKERIKQMEEERKKNARANGDGEDKERLAQASGVLAKAKRMMDEEMDDVKSMNQMMIYSKVVTIRDAQIQEKRMIQEERNKEERELDMMMEIERLKQVKLHEEREQARLEDQRRGAQVIVEQIKDRQAHRMREEDARDQEREFVLKQIDALKQEQAEHDRARKVAGAKLMSEVNAANAAAMKIKEDKMLAERLEDEKIEEYRREVDRKEKEAE